MTYHMLQCIMQHLHLTKGAPPQGQAAAAGGRTPQGGAYGGAPPSMTGEGLGSCEQAHAAGVVAVRVSQARFSSVSCHSLHFNTFATCEGADDMVKSFPVYSTPICASSCATPGGAYGSAMPAQQPAYGRPAAPGGTGGEIRGRVDQVATPVSVGHLTETRA